MNVVSMVDTCGDNAVSTHKGTTIPQHMRAVLAVVVMNLTDQQDKIILLSMAVTISRAELQWTPLHRGSSGMDDGLFGTECPQEPHLIG
jgi:hypothetical protein